MGTVSGLDASKLSLWGDVSHWNSTLDPAILQNVDGLFCKMTDGKQMYEGNSLDLQNYKDKTFDANVQLCYEAGKPCIPYHYTHFVLDAGWTMKSIVEWQYKIIINGLKNKIPGKSFHALALDIEERNSTSTNAKAITEWLYNLLSEAPEVGGVPILFYSSMSILNLYPALRDWLSYPGANKNLWLAQWAYSSTVQTTWEQLRSQYIAALNMRVTTPGFADWRFVQWSAAFKMPGCTIPLDLNFYKGDTAAAYAWLGYKQTTPEPPPPVVPPDGQDDKSIEERLDAVEAELGRINARLNRHILD